MKTKKPFGTHNSNRPLVRTNNTANGTSSGIENQLDPTEPTSHHDHHINSNVDFSSTSSMSSMTMSLSAPHLNNNAFSSTRRNSGGKPPLPPTNISKTKGSTGLVAFQKSKRRKKKKTHAASTTTTRKTTPHSSTTPKISNRYSTAVAPSTTDSLISSTFYSQKSRKNKASSKETTSKQNNAPTLQNPPTTATASATTAQSNASPRHTNAAAEYLLAERSKTQMDVNKSTDIKNASPTLPLTKSPADVDDILLVTPKLSKMSVSTRRLLSNISSTQTHTNVNNSGNTIHDSVVPKIEELTTFDVNNINKNDNGRVMDCDSDDESLEIETDKPAPAPPISKYNSTSSLPQNQSHQDSKEKDTREGWVLQRPSKKSNSNSLGDSGAVSIVDNEEDTDTEMEPIFPMKSNPTYGLHNNEQLSLTPAPTSQKKSQDPSLINNKSSTVKPTASTTQSESTSPKFFTKGMIQRARLEKVDNTAVIAAMLASGPDRGSIILKQRKNDDNAEPSIVGTTLEVIADGGDNINDDASELTALTMEDLKYTNKSSITSRATKSEKEPLTTKNTSTVATGATTSLPIITTQPRNSNTPKIRRRRSSLLPPSPPSLKKVLSANRGLVNQNSNNRRHATIADVSTYASAIRTSDAIKRNATTLPSPRPQSSSATLKKSILNNQQNISTTGAVHAIASEQKANTKQQPLPISSATSNSAINSIKQERIEIHEEQRLATDTASVTARQLFKKATPKSNQQPMSLSSSAVSKRTPSSTYASSSQNGCTHQITVPPTQYQNNAPTVYNHPPLPPGWIIKVSKTKNRVFYCHPDFGSTWHCPVVLPNMPSAPSSGLPDTSEISTGQTKYTHSETHSNCGASSTAATNSYPKPLSNDLTRSDDVYSEAYEQNEQEEELAAAANDQSMHSNSSRDQYESGGESPVLSDGTIHHSDSAVIVQHSEISDKYTDANIADRNADFAVPTTPSDHHKHIANDYLTEDSAEGSNDIIEDEIAVSRFAHHATTLSPFYKTSNIDDKNRIKTENKVNADVDLIENGIDFVDDDCLPNETGAEGSLASHSNCSHDGRFVSTNRGNCEHTDDNLDIFEGDMDGSEEDDNSFADEGFDGVDNQAHENDSSANDDLDSERHFSGEDESNNVYAGPSPSVPKDTITTSIYTSNHGYARRSSERYSPRSFDSNRSQSIQSIGHLSRSTAESLVSYRVLHPPHPICSLQNLEALFRANSLRSQPKLERSSTSFTKTKIKTKKRTRNRKKAGIKIPDPIRRRLVYSS